MEEYLFEWIDVDLIYDVEFDMSLPADTPEGHPHVLKASGPKSRNVKAPKDICLIDVVV